MNNKNNYESNIWKLYLFTFIHHLHFISAVLIPFFIEWGKIPFYQIMILQAIFTASALLFEAPTGVIADKYGRKNSIAIGSLVSAFGFLLYILYPSFYIFALGEIILGLGLALISGADESLFYDTLRQLKREKESKKLLSRLDSLNMLGLLISAPIGGFIAYFLGVRWAFGLMIVPILISFFIILSVKEPKIGRASTRNQHYIDIFRKGISFFANHKILKIMAIDATIVSALMFFVIWVYQYKLQELGVSIAYFGLIHAFLVIAQIIVLNSFSFLEKAIGGKSRYLLLSALVPGVFFIILGASYSPVLAIVSMMVIAGFGLSRKRLYFNYMHKYIPSTKRATVISSVSMIYRLAMTLNNIIMGFLVNWNLQYALYILGATVIFLALLIKIEEKHLKD
ncbi:MFS transporter [Candidatus Pacearchaeota archaeon]|nr:MFS transporter [Candidatus Pacearchaeota archaeon]